MANSNESPFHGTTILAVRRDGKVCVGGDGQVTLQNSMIMKGTARKVRRLHDQRVIVGFAGATADAMTLFEKLETKLEEHGGNLQRAAVEAMLIAADRETLLLISGTGDVIEPDGGVVAIGSGGGFALAAARALYDQPSLDAEAIVRKGLEIAAGICVYTNTHLTVETI